MRTAEVQRLDVFVRMLMARTTPIGTPQAAWYIDPSNATGRASDANLGTSAAPLLTTAGLQEKIGTSWIGLSSRVDVTFLSAFPADAPQWPIDLITIGSGFVFLHGFQTAAHAGALSAATVLNRAGNAPMLVTDSAGFDFTPYVGTSFLKITSGPNAGAMAELRKNLGGGQVQLGELFIPDPLASGPAPIFTLVGNETYQVVTPSHVPSIISRIQGPRHISSSVADLVIQDCAIKGVTGDVSGFGGTSIGLTSCTIDNAQYTASLTSLQGCIMTSGSFHLIENGGQVSCYGGMAYGALVSVNAGILGASRDWGPQTFGEVFVSAKGYLEFTEMSAFDCDAPFIVAVDGSMQALGGSPTHTLWGTGNTTCVVQVAADTGMVVSSGTTLVATGGGGGYTDFMLDGLHATSFVRSDNGAFVAGPVACTWANLAAPNPGGFGGNATNPVSQARVVTSTAF